METSKRERPMVSGTHAPPKEEKDASDVVVTLDMSEVQTNQEGIRINKAETELRLPTPSQFMDAEVFAAEQAQLRDQNSKKGNDGRKTLMVSHW